MKLLTILLFTAALGAQTSPVTAPTITTAPLEDYQLAFGYGVSPSASVMSFPANKEGWVSAGVRVTTSCYLTSILDITANANTLRGGAQCQMARSGDWTLSPRIDGGLSIGAVSIASFAGGVVVAHPLPGKLNGWNITGELRITANPAGPTGSVNLGVYVGISKGFWKN